MGNHRAERGSRRTASAERAPRTPLITRNAPKRAAGKADAGASRVSAISGDAQTTVPRTVPGKRAARPAEGTGTFRFGRGDTGTTPAVSPVASPEIAPETRAIPAPVAAIHPTAIHVPEAQAPETRDVVSPTQGHVSLQSAPQQAAPALRVPSTSSAAHGHPQPGRRRTTKRSGSGGPLFKGLPSAPVLGGVAALAVSIGGALAGPGLTATDDRAADLSAASAMAPVSDEVLAERKAVVSRDHRRALATEASDARRLAEAEKAAAARDKTLTTLNKKATKQAAKIEANRWHTPVRGYRITATFGLSSYLWSTVHTGLDFAGPYGSPLMAVANGTITEVGSAGAYGTRTILTLEDGTEIWYCHQSAVKVSVGQKVIGGQVIGNLGNSGNSTGPHLHLEVRPAGGDPVDPYSTFIQHGMRP